MYGVEDVRVMLCHRVYDPVDGVRLGHCSDAANLRGSSKHTAAHVQQVCVRLTCVSQADIGVPGRGLTPDACDTSVWLNRADRAPSFVCCVGKRAIVKDIDTHLTTKEAHPPGRVVCINGIHFLGSQRATR